MFSGRKRYIFGKISEATEDDKVQRNMVNLRKKSKVAWKNEKKNGKSLDRATVMKRGAWKARFQHYVVECQTHIESVRWGRIYS